MIHDILRNHKKDLVKINNNNNVHGNNNKPV